MAAPTGHKDPQATEPKQPAAPPPPPAPAAPKAPKPKAPKPPAAPKPSAPLKAAPPKPPSPSVPIPNSITGKPIGTPETPIDKALAQSRDPNFAAKQQRRTQVILRRQGLLKNMGLYTGQIDGQWGPASQHAWNVYVYRRRQGTLQAPFIAPAQVVAQEKAASRASTLDQARAAAKLARTQGKAAVAAAQASATAAKTVQDRRIAADVHAQLARETAANVAVMKRLRDDPAAAATVTLHQLTAAVIDKANGWKPTNRADVLVVQRWLNTHGQAVALSGSYDRQTNDALGRAYHQADIAQHNAAIHQVVDRFYGGNFDSHNRPSWWIDSGPVPTPERLLQILQRGGFYADSLLKRLISSGDGPQLVYAQWRDQQLQAMLTKYKSAFDAPNFVAASGPLAVTAQNIIDRANHVLSPQSQAEFAAQMHTLLASRSGDEFSRQIAAAVAEADLRYTAEQATRAAKHTPWWGTAAHYAMTPLNEAEKGVAFTKTAFITDFFMGADILVYGHLQHPLEAYWEGAVQGQANAPLALRLANEFVADPLIYLRPLRVASTALKYGVRLPIIERDVLGGYKLAEAGGRYGALSRRVVYDDATWHIPIKTALGTQLRSIPGVGKALAMKSELIDQAQQQIILASRHGFAGPRRAFAALGEHVSYQTKISPKIRALLANDRHQLALGVEAAHPLLLDALKQAGGSFYADAYRANTSRLGNRIIARYAEEIRVQEVHRLANLYSQDVYERAASGGFTSAEYENLMAAHNVTRIDGEIVPIAGTDGSPRAFADAVKAVQDAHPEPPLPHETAAKRAHDAYVDVKRRAGLFYAGAGDPELTAIIDKRTANLLEQFKEVTLPAIQDALENHYDAVGHDLWDAGGRLASASDGTDSDAFAAFRERNLVELKNPLYGQELTLEQAIPIIESEIRRKQARILNWADAERAHGNPIPEAAVAKLLGDAAADVKRAFIEGDAEYHVAVNREAVNHLLESQGLPVHTPVEVEWRPGSKAMGEYHGGRARIYADPELLSKIDVAGDAAHRFLTAEYHNTVAHEIRHAFQDVNWPKELFNDRSAGYWDSPVEQDARNFADSSFAVDFAKLVTIARPRGGVIVDARKTLMVPDIYARDHAKTFSYMTPRWAKGASGGLLDRQPLSAIAGAPARALGTPVDDEIGAAVWILGSLHSDTLANLGADTIDATARRFHAAKGTPFEEWGPHAEQMAAYRAATQRYHLSLGAATDQALPYALLSNHLIMVALSRAQTMPFRVLYKALDGAMNTWIFATLPLRTGWMVRNVLDNAAKSFIAGARDPRDYFRVYQGGRISTAIGDSLGKVSSVFDAGMGPLLETVRFFDSIFGTDSADHFASLLDTFWTHQLDVIDHVFKTQGWNVPSDVLEGARLNPFQRRVGGARLTKTGLFDPEELNALPQEHQDIFKKHFAANASSDPGRYSRFRDGMWHLFANTPENYYKKVLYNSTLRKLTDDGMSAVDAHAIAWKKVEDTLFDYSKVSGLEDNMRIFLPFIQFWRKNTGLWARNFATNPWLTVEMNNYLTARDNAHADEPPWMRRYFNVKEITDAAAIVPGLQWLAEQILPADGQFDPLSFASFSPYYRAFKAGNPTLPTDQQGMAFFGPLFDSLNDWGLGLSPFFRKPLESAHIASQRSWQTVFPQTAVASALTRQFFGDTAAGYVMDWERIFTLMQGTTPSDQIAQSFEFYVRREEENQVAQGEPINRAKAAATIRTWFLAQNTWGYFGGIYFRRNTPEDYYAAKLQNDVMTGGKPYDSLSERDKTLLSLWSKSGIDKTTGRLRIDQQTWDRYVETLPLIDAFYKQGSYAAGQHMLVDHPELIQYVDPAFTKGRYFGVNYAKAAAMYLHGAEFFDTDKLLAELKLPNDMRKAAASILITPELQAFWAKNDTPADARHKMLSGELHGYLNDLNDHYWAIPATDPAARSAFLREHPDLARSWQHNNSRADDFHMIANDAKGTLRETYFATVREHGFAAGSALLQQYPFMFEGTSAANRIDEATGTWKPKNMGVVQAAAWRTARAAIAHYFNLRDNGNKAAASAWLNADTPEAKLARDYFRTYGHHNSSAHASDYLRAKPWLSRYFNMAHSDRSAWLRGDSTGARIVRDYFTKYSHSGGMTAHARAYLAAKSALDHYFSLDKPARAAWLKHGGRDAATVLDYFKNFGANNRIEGFFRAAHPGLITTDPELRRRLEFWATYYKLTPDQRPAYIISDAENHGVFVFGALGDGDAHNREQKYIRAAMAATVTVDGKRQHLSRRAATFLYVKPLLNQLYAIPAADRTTFIDANPELKDYLAAYSHPSFTGHPALDAEIGTYFGLAQGSTDRAAFLSAHPDVQAYFSAKATPQQRAMFALLDTFFSLPRREMNDFKLAHPEIQAYFDQLRLKQGQDNAIFAAFDSSDPRLHDYWYGQQTDFQGGGARMLALLREAHIRQYTPKTIADRRDRAPAPDAGLGGKKIHKPV